jgi:signal transduction histidine kinase
MAEAAGTLKILRDRWGRLSLALQYSIAGTLVVFAAMFVIGFWVTSVIGQAIKDDAAGATALYVDSVIAPVLPELRSERPLDEGVVRALDESLSAGRLGERLKSFKIWRRDGSVLYATDASLIGRRFPISDALGEAWQGHVVAELDELSDAESENERDLGIPLMEIYSPIREPWSGEVVAVSEFYEVASDITRRLAEARWNSWLLVAGVTAAMVGLLASIVFRGSKTIDRQQSALTERVSQLSMLSEQNYALRQRVLRASKRAATINERYLRRIGADLHDGPAQLVAYATLRLDTDTVTGSGAPAGAREKEIAAIRSSLIEAMAEIRSICNGLILPHIETSGPAAIIDLAISAHEQRTGGQVQRPAEIIGANLSTSEKIVVFRFIQEALNNAYRHGGGKNQAVSAGIKHGRLCVEVSDGGPGFDPTQVRADGLGLSGLKERLESIGGQFDLKTSSAGTRVAISFTVEEFEQA